MASQERLVAHVGIDAGIVVIGDPCYLVAGGGPTDLKDVVAQVFTTRIGAASRARAA